MTTLHKIVYTILRPLVYLFLRLKFGYECQRPTDLPENYIVLANHATNFDPVFVAVAFPQMYFVGSEHISRWGLGATLIKFFLDPIFRPKGSVASHTVKEILQRLRGGHNVCLFAEGSCTWDGSTAPILPSTGKMVQKARCGLVTYKLTGGYFAAPRWGTGGSRRGPVRGQPAGIYTKEQLAAMTTDEINELIRRDLWEDAYERQLGDPQPYRSKKSAEGLEYLLFKCPDCGEVDTFFTDGHTVECSRCGLQFRFDEYGMLDGVPFGTLREFTNWQKEQARLDAENGIPYTSDSGRLITVANSVTSPVDEGPVSLTSEAITCGGTVIPLSQISNLDIHSKNALVFTAGKTYYELIPSGNAYKFYIYYQQLAKVMQETAAVE